jgi:hypothetical protein
LVIDNDVANANRFRASNRDPAQAAACAKSGRATPWEGFTARSEATAALARDARAFHLTISLSVFVNDALHFQRRWCQSTERVLL